MPPIQFPPRLGVVNPLILLSAGVYVFQGLDGYVINPNPVGPSVTVEGSDDGSTWNAVALPFTVGAYLRLTRTDTSKTPSILRGVAPLPVTSNANNVRPGDAAILDDTTNPPRWVYRTAAGTLYYGPAMTTS